MAVKSKGLGRGLDTLIPEKKEYKIFTKVRNFKVSRKAGASKWRADDEDKYGRA